MSSRESRDAHAPAGMMATAVPGPDDLAAVVIRPASLDDEAAVRAITIEAFDGVSIDQNIERRLGPAASSLWHERKGAAVGAELRAAPEQCYVAEVDGLVIGYVTTDVSKATSTGRIPNIGVAHPYRGRGLGSRLIEHALRCFRRRGLRLARIETLEQNAVGQHLYQKLGFREVARQIHYAMPLASVSVFIAPVAVIV